MAENKTKPTKVSVAAFLEAVPSDARRADAKAIIKLMRSITGESPKMWGPSIIGFGSYHYRYETGREGDMPVVGFSPRKAATVLYVSGGFPEFDALMKKLGKTKTNGGCIYVNKLSDLDPRVFEALIAKSVKAVRAKYGGEGAR